MKFSFTLPHFGWWDGSFNPRDLQRIALAAEQAGFSACGVSDHPFPRMGESPGAHHTMDPLVLLTYVGAVTERIGLHPNVFVASYRHPFVFANSIASLDELSGGRVILGLGAGYLLDEFRALGSDFDSRFGVLEEVVGAFRAAWPGDPLDFDGRYFHAYGNSLRDVPVATPPPRIWLAGNSDRAARRAARLGDGWSPVMHPPGSALIGMAIGPGGKGRTADITSSAHLADRIVRVRAEVPAKRDAAYPFEVCLVRGGHWSFDDWDQLRADYAELEEVGVDWIALHLKEEGGVAGLIGQIELFGDHIISKGATTP